MIRVFIGYDQREKIAFNVLVHSIISNSSVPVSIIPVARNHIKHIYDKPVGENESTEFSMTRFLVPYLSNYEGWSIFMDCDMVNTSDIKQLWDLRDEKYSVMCVKHDYEPSTNYKFLDQKQTKYKKKNWSSVMLFNNRKCKSLTPESVIGNDGLYLHQFKWLEDEKLIGSLPTEWNFLVGEHIVNQSILPSLIHFTLGGPWFKEYESCDYSNIWFSYLNQIQKR